MALKPEHLQRPWSVAELARQVQMALRPLAQVFIKGEVTNLKASPQGHLQFRIRDDHAVIDAFMFATEARRSPAMPSDGHAFIFRGRVDFWPPGGKIRVLVDHVEFDDVGRLRAQLELLKQKLEVAGAFAPERKRPLPFLPRGIALVTSATGAVIHDLRETIWERFPGMRIVLYAVTVQGSQAASEVVTAVRRANREALADVIIIARGGGSFEDLYAFNTEPVVRAILASAIPVVTALGHTSDRTLADLVADEECRTPTAAGSRVVPRSASLRRDVAERHRRLDREWARRRDAASTEIHARGDRLSRAVPALFAARRERLARGRDQLVRLHPSSQLEQRVRDLTVRRGSLVAAVERLVRSRFEDLGRRRGREVMDNLASAMVSARESEIKHRSARIEALDPARVLERGYAIVTEPGTGRIIRRAADTAAGARLDVVLSAGALAVAVESVKS